MGFDSFLLEFDSFVFFVDLAKLRFQQQIQGLRAAAAQHAERKAVTRVPRLTDPTLEDHLGAGTPLLCGDGIYLARQVEICSSPDEEEAR